MPDRVNINLDLGLVEIQSFGIVTAENIAASIKKAEEAFKLHGINKLLVDTTRQEQMPRISSIFNIFANFPKHLILALFAKKKQITEADIIFGENVAVNRGVTMKIFYAHMEAMAWLNSFNGSVD